MGRVSLRPGEAQSWDYISWSKGLVTEQGEPTVISCKLDADWLLLKSYNRFLGLIPWYIGSIVLPGIFNLGCTPNSWVKGGLWSAWVERRYKANRQLCWGVVGRCPLLQGLWGPPPVKYFLQRCSESSSLPISTSNMSSIHEMSYRFWLQFEVGFTIHVNSLSEPLFRKLLSEHCNFPIMT